MGGKIVQRYIPNPYLLEKEGKTFKFDLRQWVLVISSPESVKCLIHYTCYLRICKSEYDITNFSGDKHFTNFNVSGGKEGCYMSEEDFEVYLGIKEEGGKWKKIKKDMEEAIVASIECTDVKAGKYGYEFLGYDFLVDEDFKVWLLEVNCSPGLRKQRGGIDVSEEIERMQENVWNLTVGSWYNLPTPSTPCFKELRLPQSTAFARSISERELIDFQGVQGYEIKKKRMEVVDKLVGEENSRVVLGRNLRGWGRRRVRVFRARGVVVGWVGRVWRGGGVRVRLFKQRQVMIIARFLTKCGAINKRWRRRRKVEEGLREGGRVLKGTMWRRLCGRGFAVLKFRWSCLRRIKVNLDFQRQVRMIQKCLLAFLGHKKANRIISENVYRVVIVRKREMKRNGFHVIKRAWRGYLLRREIDFLIERGKSRSLALSAIREKMSLRSLGCFTSICKKCLRKQRLNKIIEDVEREKREEELRVLMEGERKRLVKERKRRERERREEEAIKTLELEMAEKKRLMKERQKIVEAKALTFGVKSVKTLRVVGEHEELLRELEECMVGTPKSISRDEENRVNSRREESWMPPKAPGGVGGGGSGVVTKPKTKRKKKKKKEGAVKGDEKFNNVMKLL
ncbi:hypothetical protein TrLO_g1887 [Triparma laevis f. longispina]|uniref:Uncharacterized protein n=1 Tax=Triparma laevis f. longispina TaxID=1714387 RepID=A0A9W7FJ84_9STRA|nr:hypothetical protein TrLO_g1887 [Triparma laevis f. longispina]